MKSGTHNIGWSAHHCPAVVLTCMDFRVPGRKVEEIVATVFDGEEPVVPFDEIRIAGSAKAINGAHADLILESVLISVEKHGAKRVIIINHHDCGAYGGANRFQGDDEERQFHTEELKKAKLVVRERLDSAGKDDVSVDLLYVSATGMMPVSA